MPSKKTPAAPALALRDACIVAAREVIAERGVEKLSLRDVARRLGVSHQAPYRHYPSRDHLLAEVMRGCFEQFAAHLDTRVRADDPKVELEALGRLYLAYAADHPLEYRLMFSTAWPAAAEHPALVRDAAHTFDILRKVLRRVHGSTAAVRDAVDLDAMFIWSTMHGLAGVMNGNAIGQLSLKPRVLSQAAEHAMNMVGAALAARAG
jgi:AcrR family transcriptional regulator